MQNYKSFGAAIAVASALFAISAPAHAQATRTWVSGVGNDANPCSRTSPCKTFAGAMSEHVGQRHHQLHRQRRFRHRHHREVHHDRLSRRVRVDPERLAGARPSNGIIINVPVGASGGSAANRAAAQHRHFRRRHRQCRHHHPVGHVGDPGGYGHHRKRQARHQRCAHRGQQHARHQEHRRRQQWGTGIAGNAQTNTLVLDNVQSIKNAYGLALAKNNTATVMRSVFSNNTTAGVEADPGGQLMLDSSIVSYNPTGIASNGGPVGFANSNVSFNATGDHRRDDVIRKQPHLRQRGPRNGADARRRCYPRARSTVTPDVFTAQNEKARRDCSRRARSFISLVQALRRPLPSLKKA